MNNPIEVMPGAPGGTTYTNKSTVPQLVTLVDGPDDPESALLGKRRTFKTVLAPGKSRTIDISPTARMTTSTDVSSMQGKITLIGGCGNGCTHGAD